MADPLFELLSPHLPQPQKNKSSSVDNEASTKYLSRLLSLHLSDLTTTEPQSIVQATQSNLVSLQALSSRSHRTTTTSSDHLSTLKESLPSLTHSVTEVREAVPALDESAVKFASTYGRSRDQSDNAVLTARKESQILLRQADKLQDILELPNLLSAAIASAGSGTAGSTNYNQALDLFVHIKRLQIVYPDSLLVKSVLVEAETAMNDMTTNLVNSLRNQNIRLAAAIRTIGWLRRVVPELGNVHHASNKQSNQLIQESVAGEGSFGLLFLTARLATFLQMTEALAPLRDLADQESERRPTSVEQSTSPTLKPGPPSQTLGHTTSQGQQTERYLKRYIEIFREQSFSTISMYRNIFPAETLNSESSAIPSALQTFPLHLVEILMEVMQTYLPNVMDLAARESLLMQVLYAANSLGRLGADFSMMISLLDTEGLVSNFEKGSQDVNSSQEEKTEQSEPEWSRVIKKHRVQAARLDALASGQNQASRRESDITVR